MRYGYLAVIICLAACTAGEAPVIGTPGGNDLYDTLPDIANCNAGQLKTAEKQKVLDKVNEIRALHGLSAVSYDVASDSAEANAALIMVANNVLTHAPANTLACYSASGSTGAGSSNLYLMSGSNMTDVLSVSPIENFLTDTNVASLGHRRWLLYPFLSSTAYGRVDGSPQGSSGKVMSAALKVIGGANANLSSSNLTFVAYPYGNYPASYVNKSWYLSFSVLADRLNAGNNGSNHVDYSSATVEVFDNNLNAMTVSSVSADYQGYGLANNLQWKVAGLSNGVTYTVKVNNVMVDSVLKVYQYTFTLMP